MSGPAPRRLLSPRGLLAVWLPLTLFVVAHYVAPPHLHWVHDVARRGFYLPIVMAGTLGGVGWGLLLAVITIGVYAPHAFLLHDHADPASGSEKLLEMVFYVVLGLVSGLVAERLHRERERLAATTVELRRTLADVRVKDALLARTSRLESLGQLTAGLAHEIRNPLHAMRGTAEILLDAVPEEAPEHAIGRSHIAEIDRLSGVLKRFLDFARHREPELSRVDLSEVAHHVADLVRAQAARQGTTVAVAEGTGAVVQADRDLIVQVALGICLNALQALVEGGRVELSAADRLRIFNDGPPIPEELLDRIFDPFVTSRDEGTGLGLATAWRIIDDHGGRIEARNVEGGVEFVVRLPGDG